MAGPFYVDIGSPGSWQGRDGTNNESPWLGITGLQKAFDTVDADEICYVKGTGDISNFYTVTFDANSGTTLTDGEEVTWDTGEGAWDDGSDKGIVHCGDTTAVSTVEIELTVGTMPADNDVIKGTTSTQTITRAATANAIKGIDVDTMTGANARGWIKFVGTNASWTVDGTRAYLDAKGAAISIITHNTANKNMYWFANLELDEAGTSGFYGPTSGRGMMYVNCCVHNCGDHGFYSNIGAVAVRCTAYSNTGTGFYFLGAYSRAFFCCSHDNTGDGYYGSNYTVFYGCISHGNTDDGFNVKSGTVILNCVSDSNGDNGMENAASSEDYASLIAIGNRITNHSGAGDIGLATINEPTITGWNYFENNDGDNIQGTLHYFIPIEGGATTSNKEDQSDTDYGYVDTATDDYATDYTGADDPTLRREAITIPWS